jgi:diacylglycerol kinase (ATP)
MRLAIIINPISGWSGSRESAGRLRLAHARRLIDRPRVDADIVLTAAQGHGAELARGYVAKNFDVVMAWGGDGTVNEIAGPLIGTQTALGIIPSGSGNGLARSLGLRTDTAAAFAAAVAGPTGHIDVGYMGERHFLNVAGIGFDAAIASSFNTGAKRGALGYVTRILRMVWSYRPDHYEITLDGQTRDSTMFLVAFANGREYGNHLVLAPDANPHDGWLDAVLVDDGPPLRQLWRARRLSVMPRRPAEGLSRRRIRTASVRGHRLTCHVDGESFEAAGALHVKLAPGALLVRGITPDAVVTPS